MNEYCGGCHSNSVQLECIGAFARKGIVKVHWECWAACNLNCAFCYRTRQKPLSTNEAMTLIKGIWTAGARWITFAGGDPSIRPDIIRLIRNARELGLKVEVQTNAQRLSIEFKEAIVHLADQVGLSIDGPDAFSHDKFRSCPGNFDKVVGLLSELNEARVPVVVRTVIAKNTFRSASLIGNILRQFPTVKRWSLLEFSPLNEGFENRGMYEISLEEFQGSVESAAKIAADSITVDGFGNAKKGGTYALVSPAGDLYGTVSDGRYIRHVVVGSMLSDHLSDLAAALPLDEDRHKKRYGDS